MMDVQHLFCACGRISLKNLLHLAGAPLGEPHCPAGEHHHLCGRHRDGGLGPTPHPCWMSLSPPQSRRRHVHPRKSAIWLRGYGASRIGMPSSLSCPQPLPPPRPSVQPKLLSHYGHDINVSILILDTPHARGISTLLARTTIHRITRAPSLGDLPPSLRFPYCPQCGLLAGSHKSLERHVARCPNGGARHWMHHGLIKSSRVIVEEACVPKAAIVEEAR